MEYFSHIREASLDTVISFAVTFVICIIAMRVITGIVNRLLNRSRIDHTVRNLINTILKIGLWALAVIIIADSLGISTASLIAVLSVAGLALSLSVQDIMSNIFSGIIILLFNHTFKKGDYVDIGSISGTVDNVGITHTFVKTLDNRLISIPNKDVAAASVVNYNSEALRRVDMKYTADYEDSTEAVTAAIRDAIAMDDRIMQDPAPFIGISSFNDSNIEYAVRVWCRTEHYWDVYFALNNNIRITFDKNNVHMTYNHINVHLQNS